MILGFSLHGKGELGVELSRRMEKDQRAEIDQLTCVAVLHCCTTACMVDREGKFYFKCIKEPKVAHYTLMVSLLARVRVFDEARAFIEKHHIERSAEVLRALLDGCWIHHRRNIGKRVFKQLCCLKPLKTSHKNWISIVHEFGSRYMSLNWVLCLDLIILEKISISLKERLINT